MIVEPQMYAYLASLYRAQPRSRPNHSQVSELSGLNRRTVVRGYSKGWPRTRNRPELPPIKRVLEEEEEERAASSAPSATSDSSQPVAYEAATSLQTPTTAEPTAFVAVPAPVPPVTPQVPSTREPAHVLATPAPDAPAMGEPAPAPVAVRAPPMDPVTALRDGAAKAILQELDILNAARNNAVGLLTTGGSFLKALHDAAPQIKKRLIDLATEKPERAVSLLGELSKIESETVRSAERLVAVQRVLAGLPGSITEHRVAPSAPPEDPAAAAARVRDILAEVAAAGRTLTGDGRVVTEPPEAECVEACP